MLTEIGPEIIFTIGFPNGALVEFSPETRCGNIMGVVHESNKFAVSDPTAAVMMHGSRFRTEVSIRWNYWQIQWDSRSTSRVIAEQTFNLWNT